MKTKLFVLSLLLSFVVTVAKAWSGVDDDWWSDNGYTTLHQYAGQAYDAGRDFTINSYGDYVTEDVATLSGSGYNLDWSDFDKAKNEII